MRNAIRILLCICLACWAAAGCRSADDQAGQEARVPGVSDTSIRLGSSLALTGHAGYLGTQTLRGAQAYLRHINDNGGVHGRRVDVVALDDSYDPPRCLVNTQNLIIDNNVLALFCYVGTPTTVKVLPLVEEARIPLIGMFTGANRLREPFNRYVVNIRASYYQETASAVRHIVQDLGLKRIAVFYQYDAYGFDGLVGAELALKKFGLSLVARASYVRGTQNVEDALIKIRNSGAEAVVMVGTYGACSRFINLAREDNFQPLFYNVSFVGAEELARRIGSNSTTNVIMSQVVPPTSPAGDSGVVSEYMELLGKYFPNDNPSFVGLEGFLNARIMVEGLERAGRELTREGLIRAIESIHNMELGPGMSITYGPRDRQGLEAIYFTRLEHGRFVSFDNWNGLKKRLENVQ